MDNYKYLEHTADVLFEAYGTNFEEALEHAADAMLNIIANGVKPKKTFEFRVMAASKEDLVVQVLSNLLSYADVHQMVPCNMKIEELKIGDICSASCRAFGESFNERIKVKTIVKGITYHELLVEEKPNNVRIRVLLDV